MNFITKLNKKIKTLRKERKYFRLMINDHSRFSYHEDYDYYVEKEDNLTFKIEAYLLLRMVIKTILK